MKPFPSEFENRNVNLGKARYFPYDNEPTTKRQRIVENCSHGPKSVVLAEDFIWCQKCGRIRDHKGNWVIKDPIYNKNEDKA